jgi:hypothetical protein
MTSSRPAGNSGVSIVRDLVNRGTEFRLQVMQKADAALIRDGIEDLQAVLSPTDQTILPHLGEMLGHGRLGQICNRGQLGDRRLTHREATKDQQAFFVCQELQKSRRITCLFL